VSKLILLSIIIVSYMVPVWLAKSAQPRRALRRVQWIVFAFIIVWAFLCTRWYPELVELK
jgi:hypothetical protein